jgi:hypothetical protein
MPSVPTPFELSGEGGLVSPPTPKKAEKKAEKKAKAGDDTEDSSDFDLTPTGKKSPSGVKIDDSSSEFSIDSSSDFELSVNPDESDMDAGLRSAESPVGKGVKKADDLGADAIDFELNTPEGESPSNTPVPAPVSDIDSSSEFELTLDNDEGLAPLEAEGSSDLVETGFSPAGLVDESGVRAATTGDSDLDSSEFELALDEGSGSGSDEVVIDEDAGDSEATAIRPSVLEEEDELFADSGEVAEEELLIEEPAEEGEPVAVGAPAEAAPAEWGAWSFLHIPTTLFLLFGGFLLFEMMRSVMSHTSPTLVGGPIFDLFSKFLK